MQVQSAQTIAQWLLATGAIGVSSNTPFRLRSGWASPVYVDMRKTLSKVQARDAIVDAALALVQQEGIVPEIDVVVGAEVSGIPIATLLADRLKLPLQFARKKALGFGQNAQLEGSVVPNARALLVDDLLTDGKSKENFCAAIRAAGQQVRHVLSVFDYQLFRPNLASLLGARVHHLCSWNDVLQEARASNSLSTDEIKLIETFLSDAAGWSARHSGIKELT